MDALGDVMLDLRLQTVNRISIPSTRIYFNCVELWFGATTRKTYKQGEIPDLLAGCESSGIFYGD
jgi:hypothetical protein